MKKKLLLILLLPVFILLLTGCGKKESTTKTIPLVDSVFGYATTFNYDVSENYSGVTKKEGGASKEIEFKNEDLDVSFQMYYTKMSKTSYDRSKEVRSAQKYYKEYKFGKYDAYAYGEYADGIYLNILIDVDSTETAKILFVSIDRLDTNDSVVVADVLDKDLKKFFNTIKVESVDE